MSILIPANAPSCACLEIVFKSVAFSGRVGVLGGGGRGQ